MKRVFITGTAGFIGFHLALQLLREGFEVHGYDGMTDYYDVEIKKQRHRILSKNARFSATEAMLEDSASLDAAINMFTPEVIVHLAAQAGVRYSLENPRAYIDANIIGTFNVMEAARRQTVKHFLVASTSSVYGANSDMPFYETANTNTQLTIYAATKKATEAMGHSYAHLWDLPTTMFRFFTVYGPWGRPDLALYKFVDAIIEGREIDIYNNGDMYRDFTYIDDLAHSIRLLIDVVPIRSKDVDEISNIDSLSPVAPFRIVNIGNSEKVSLLDFINAIENELGIKAKRNYMEMQKGDVHATWANTDLLKELTGYLPDTNFKEGITHFVGWFREYYKK
jgi:UDP-glucuronate 4-epimerase